MNLPDSIRVTHDVKIVQKSEQVFTFLHLICHSSQRSVLCQTEEQGHEWVPLLAPLPDVTPFIFPDEVGGLAIESSDEWQDFATVLNAHQHLQQGIPRHKIEGSYAIDGENGGLSITISQMLQEVRHTLTTGACCQSVLPWCCGHLNLFGNLFRNCSCDASAEKITNDDASHATIGFTQCCDASQPYRLLNPEEPRHEP